LRVRLQACSGIPPCTWLAQEGLVQALRSGSVALSWASARAIYDQPDVDKSVPTNRSEHGADVHRLNGVPARRELLIVSPYFVPDEEGRRYLAEMVERGVRVAVLTNSLASTDSPAAHAAYARYRVELLRSGIELYEARPDSGTAHRRSHRWGHASPSSLHAKLIVQDRARAVVGSFNQDPRSRLHNTEACVAVESAELAGDLAALFEEASELHHAFRLELSTDGRKVEWYGEADGETVRFVDEPLAGVWIRLWRKALGALIPEHQL
jgi:putative cardiolipin synthase